MKIFISKRKLMKKAFNLYFKFPHHKTFIVKKGIFYILLEQDEIEIYSLTRKEVDGYMDKKLGIKPNSPKGYKIKNDGKREKLI